LDFSFLDALPNALLKAWSTGIFADLFAFVKAVSWHSLVFFVFTIIGYFAAAGGLYGFYRLRPASRFALSATDRTPLKIWNSIRNDVILSVLSSGIFAFCAALMMSAFEQGYTRLYLESDRYGFWYLGVSLVLVILLQDAYFYFTHRLAHHPKCYKWLHQGHHHFKNPTPWTAFAFDPAEALIQAVYLMGVVFIIPMHFSVLCAVVLVMTLGALIHHFGFRLFEDSAFGRWLGSWMVGPMHHWMHHRKYTAHYSLYFTFWDKVMGTQQTGYEEILSRPSVRGVAMAIATDALTKAETSSATIVLLKAPMKKAS